jgi:PKD repeat protein
VAPLDVWNPVLSEGFSFGDGTASSGVSATHTYTAPGSYQVSATATDVLGNVTTTTQTLTISQPGSGAPGAGSTRCMLSASRTQKLLGKGKITADVTCSASLEAALGGHLSVRVPRAPHGGRGGGRGRSSTLSGYALRGAHVELVAGHQTAVQLSLSTTARRAVLAALGNHRQTGLYLTLVNVTGSGASAQAHVASIVLARPVGKRHTPTGGSR